MKSGGKMLMPVRVCLVYVQWILRYMIFFSLYFLAYSWLRKSSILFIGMTSNMIDTIFHSLVSGPDPEILIIIS